MLFFVTRKQLQQCLTSHFITINKRIFLVFHLLIHFLRVLPPNIPIQNPFTRSMRTLDKRVTGLFRERFGDLRTLFRR